MGFEVKEDIMKAINGTDDQTMRTAFMLILGIFEALNDKLDRALGDRKAMREVVLNGHEPVHHSHHEWVERRIKRDPEIDSIVAWATAKKKQEEEDQKSGRKIRDGLIEKIIFAAVVGAFGFFVGRGGV